MYNTPSLKTLKHLYQGIKSNLETIIEAKEAQIEAELIIQHVLGLSPAEIISKSETHPSQNQISQINKIVRTRLEERVPLAYILEEAPFMDFSFFINPDVLIPRPETELLVEKTLDEIKKRKISHPVILDLCTGSGCIAIALKKYLPQAKIYASDISKSALSIAAVNAQKYEADIHFVLGDYLDPFINKDIATVHHENNLPKLEVIKGKPPYFDLIVSNPPYVSKEEYEKLEKELAHEPKHALIGFPYEHIKKQIEENNLLKEDGFIAFEFGDGQTEKMLEIFPEAKIYPDYAGIDRVLINKASKSSLSG